MVNLNRIIIAGKVSEDPKLHQTSSGRKFTDISLSIVDTWKDSKDKVIKKTTKINVIAWGKQAENCIKYISKGMHVMCEGRFESESYKDSDGKTQNLVRINASSIVFLEKSNMKDQ